MEVSTMFNILHILRFFFVGNRGRGIVTRGAYNHVNDNPLSFNSYLATSDPSKFSPSCAKRFYQTLLRYCKFILFAVMA